MEPIQLASVGVKAGRLTITGTPVRVMDTVLLDTTYQVTLTRDRMVRFTFAHFAVSTHEALKFFWNLVDMAV